MGFASDDKVQLEMEPFHSTGAADQDLLNRLNVFRNKQVRPLAVDLRIVVILLAILLAKLLCFLYFHQKTGHTFCHCRYHELVTNLKSGFL